MDREAGRRDRLVADLAGAGSTGLLAGDRLALVRRYLTLAGGFAPPTVDVHQPRRGWFGGGDPLWTVVARRTGEAATGRRA